MSTKPEALSVGLDALVGRLRQQAVEIATAGHNGWGNTMADAADEIERLREALKGVIGSIEFSPMGVRGITAVQRARGVLQPNAR